ncbi:hypothetical protein FOA43_004666 [Brettanomyces nanus]|uniref:RRM domain-containing protein n=1 Tax=Eeniella nana TaxID=13502 RepID=A0A875S8M7_EENNA|nr:uncharacterized protein FOA43_004666 [Brettanomyces nanus]QPG77258.1 hypothetical protein FOA43_004666 [Brettanomyces nanus]
MEVNKPGRKGRQGKRHGRRARISGPLHLDKESEDLAKGEPYLRVTNLHPDLTEKDLKQLFSTVGTVKFVKLELNTNGQSTGIAFVGFERSRDCSYAIEEFDGRRAAGQIISVENAVPLAERIFAIPQKSKKNKRGRENSDKRSRQKKTAEELDDELTRYMNGEGAPTDNDPPADAPDASVDASVDASADAPLAASPATAEPFPVANNGEMNVD